MRFAGRRYSDSLGATRSGAYESATSVLSENCKREYLTNRSPVTGASATKACM